MGNRTLENYLRQKLRAEDEPERLEETIDLCLKIMGEKEWRQDEPRLSFFGYLSETLRFEGFPIIGLQAVVLFAVILTIRALSGAPEYMPALMPLFVLAAIPAMFRGQYHGMSEIEAVTRSSGAQIVLAKLILAGAADLMCITVLLCMEASLTETGGEMGQMILYCLVPYLVCMSVMLRVIRLQRRDGIPICVALSLCSCIFWFLSARRLSWLYEISAAGIWVAAFLVFSVFFIKELGYIVRMRREGKMYGVIA